MTMKGFPCVETLTQVRTTPATILRVCRALKSQNGVHGNVQSGRKRLEMRTSYSEYPK